MVDVVDDDLLAAHFDGNDALTEDRNLRAVGEGDVLVVHLLVRDKGLVGMPEMVRGSAVEDSNVQSVGAGCGEYLGVSGVRDTGCPECLGWPRSSDLRKASQDIRGNRCPGRH